jgi:hypothetical protein
MTKQLVGVDKVVCCQQDCSIRCGPEPMPQSVSITHVTYDLRAGTYKSPNDSLEASTLGGGPGDVGRLLEPPPDNIVRPT